MPSPIKQLSEVISFTRSTGAGRFNHLGVFEWLAANQTRINHDPATLSTSASTVTIGTGSKTFAVSRLYTVGATVRATADANNYMTGIVTAAAADSVTIQVSKVAVGSGSYSAWTLIVVKGILIEPQRTNWFAKSEDLPNQAQAGPGTALTVTNADASVGHWTTVTRGVSDNYRYISQASTSVTAGASYCASMHIKKAASGFFSCRFQWTYPDRVDFILNLNTGAVTSTKSGATSSITSSFTVTDRGSYFEVVLVVSHTTATNAQFHTAPHLTALVTDAAPTGTSSFDIRMLQVEQGAFATSYIPTTNAQVIRSSDVPAVNTVSPWYNANAGAIYVEGDFIGQGVSGNAFMIALHNGTINERFAFVKTGTSDLGLRVTKGGSNLYSQNHAGLLGSQSTIKSAMAWDATGVSSNVNGANANTAALTGLPVGINGLSLGTRDISAYTEGWAGHIRRVRIYPRRSTEAKLQSLTA